MMAILFCMNAITKAQVDNPYALVFDTTRGIMYCSTNSFGVLRSDNNGTFWFKWNSGLDTGGIMFVTEMIHVPTFDGRVISNAHLDGARGFYLMERSNEDSGWKRIQTPAPWDWVKNFEVEGSSVWMAANAAGLWRYDVVQSVWQKRTPPRDSLTTHVSISRSNPASVWSSSMFLDGGYLRHRVNKSTDDGITWTPVRDTIRGVLKGLYIDPRDTDHVIVVDRHFRETFDGGVTWPRSTAPDTLSALIVKTAVDWKNGLWYSSTASDSIYMSSDQGATWKALPLAGGSFITDIILHPKNPCHIFVLKVNGLHESTDCGQTWRRNPFTLSASNQAGMPYGFEIEACYPNPLLVSQSEFYVRIRSERSSKIQFEIFDVLGRMRTASRLELHPNQPQTISLPTSSLEAGTFFLIANDGMSRRLLPLTVLR